MAIVMVTIFILYRYSQVNIQVIVTKCWLHIHNQCSLTYPDHCLSRFSFLLCLIGECFPGLLCFSCVVF